MDYNPNTYKPDKDKILTDQYPKSLIFWMILDPKTKNPERLRSCMSHILKDYGPECSISRKIIILTF